MTDTKLKIGELRRRRTDNSLWQLSKIGPKARVVLTRAYLKKHKLVVDPDERIVRGCTTVERWRKQGVP